MRTQRAVLTLLATVGSASQAQALTVTWVQPVSDSWFAPLRWSTQHPPEPTDHVVIPVPGPVYINVDQSTTIRTLTMNSFTVLNLLGGTTFSVENPGGGPPVALMSIAGVVIVNSNFADQTTQLLLNNNNNPVAALSGGQVILNATSNNHLDNACIKSLAAGGFITSTAYLRGAGNLYGSWTNNAVMEGDAPGLALQFVSGAHTNNASITALGGIVSIIAGSVTQAPGAVLGATQSGIFNLANLAVSGGAIQVSDGGLFNIASTSLTNVGIDSPNNGRVFFNGGTCSLTNVSLSGAVGIDNGAKVSVFNPGIAQNSTFTIKGGPIESSLTLNSNSTLIGIGAIVLSASPGNDDKAVLVVANNSIFQPVRGNGLVRGAWTNNSTLQADTANRTLTLRNGTVTNNGILKGTSSGILSVTNALNQSAAGRLIADGGTVNLQSDIHGGTAESVNGGVFTVLNSAWSGVTPVGTINVAGALGIDQVGLANSGTFKILSGGRMTLTGGGAITGVGNVLLSKTSSDYPFLRAENLTVTLGSSQVLSGSGEMSGNWINQGSIKPGNTAGLFFGNILVNNSLTLTSTSRLEIETDTFSLDVLGNSLRGSIALGGDVRFRISFWNFALPTTSMDFVVSAAVTGKFKTFSVDANPPPAGKTWRIYYQPTKASFRATCNADQDGDFLVDDTDFTYFISGYNLLDCADPAMPQYCPSDLNHDNVVNDADFQLFVVAYNKLLCF